jgi:hypothetical protein
MDISSAIAALVDWVDERKSNISKQTIFPSKID